MNAFVNVAPQQVAPDADGGNPRVKSFKPEHAINELQNKFIFRKYYSCLIMISGWPDRDAPIPKTLGNSIQWRSSSKGFKVIHGSRAPGLTLPAGYSHNSTKIIKEIPSTVIFITNLGRSPGGQGPQDQANLWAELYRLQGRSLEKILVWASVVTAKRAFIK